MNPALSGEEHRCKKLKLEIESSGKDWKMNPALTLETTSKENRSKELKLETVAKFSSELPEEMVETIISMLPYPEILKARTLSKDWKLRFSAPTKNPENAGFRMMLKSVSTKWPIYFLLILKELKGVVIGFDRTNNKWVNIYQ
ncbi:hypothetical protein R1flu_010963 [Riccia fluitans]|uniref:F-box domain-containing protein n=1 Tax=Riccia fluitans TaxID=41844 RepID=A0ABD1Z6H0_9MARC